jgi:hypothetical protein
VKKTILLALLLATATATAHAMNPVYPKANVVYTCTWTKPGASGKAFLTYFNLSGDMYSETGTARNAYPDGTFNDKPVSIIWDWTVDEPGSSAFTYVATQDSSHTITCRLKTFNSGNSLQFDLCSNGAYQTCSL